MRERDFGESLDGKRSNIEAKTGTTGETTDNITTSLSVFSRIASALALIEINGDNEWAKFPRHRAVLSHAHTIAAAISDVSGK